MRRWVIQGIGICLLACAGCSTTPPGPLDDLPPVAGFLADPARVFDSSTGVSPEGETGELAIRQILVSYRGSDNAHKRPWNRQQARERALALTTLARAHGVDFAVLAKRYSDDAQSRDPGGDMTVFMPGDLHPDVERAGRALKLGQISDPIETNRGFHILLRHEPNEAQAFDLLISYDGAQQSKSRQSRSREQAQKLAAAILDRVKHGADFITECYRYSDYENEGRGGLKAIFKKGAQHPQFERYVFALPTPGLSEVIETPTGFHIIKRIPVQRIQVRQLTLYYHDNPSEQTAAARSREQTVELIEELYKKATAPNADFAAFASEYSEAAEKSRGGLLEAAGRYERDPDFEHAAFSLAVGQVSRPVEVGNSFVLLKRIR